jgi:hypothetical protein
VVNTDEAVTSGQDRKTDKVKKQRMNNDILNDLRPERQVERNNKSQGFLGNAG